MDPRDDPQAFVTASPRPEPKAKRPLLEAARIVKVYGPTVAVSEMDLTVAAGEVLGLVGANGAGKSTLMRILAGVTAPDAGELSFFGEVMDWAVYSPATARRLGMRTVYQELSLCTNLTVYENFFIEQPQRFRAQAWRKQAREIAREALDTVFPGNTIDVSATLSELAIAQRQMVEIARATSDLELKLLILDEPTSSLAAEQTAQLQAYVMAKRQSGVSFVFISHRLSEVLSLADKIVVMKNGMLSWAGQPSETSKADLVVKMGGKSADGLPAAHAQATGSRSASLKKTLRQVAKDLNTESLHDLNLQLQSGEIVGLAGLEGSGQQALLQALFEARGSTKAVRRYGKVAYITGDRAKEGIFPLWSVATNMTITKLSSAGLFSPLDSKKENAAVRGWFDRLKVAGPHLHTPIVSLSGGNQQKVLIARALMADADIILLDDPTRGVDVSTKEQLYELFKDAAGRGKLVVWYSTEDEEFVICDRVVVLKEGRVVEELQGGAISKDRIIDASFSGGAQHGSAAGSQTKAKRSFGFRGPVVSFAAMALVLGVSGALTPMVFSRFGLELLIGGALPLVFAALSQMFIIGLSHVDLGIGAYMGLVNVLSATLLVYNPLLGLLTLLLGVVGYGLMGMLIYLRRIPALVVTLGASFVWIGIAYTVQSQPGGQTPEWLARVFRLEVPVVPEGVLLALLGGGLALTIYRSRYGTVLRGFGNNVEAMARSGWSPLRAYATGYMVAGVFGMLGGLSITALTTAADATATASYTLLTVAAVVMGGGALIGGMVSPFGAVFGAITLSLIGSLLGFLNVSSNYVAAVQGMLLLLVLALRLLGRTKQS